MHLFREHYTCAFTLVAKWKQGKSERFDSCDRSSNQIWSKSSIFSPGDLEIWWMTSKNDRAHVPHHIKLCVSFQIHRWIQIEVTVRKRSIRVTKCDFLSSVTLKFDGWPWKTIGHLFYVVLSFVHHSIAISKFKLDLQSRKFEKVRKYILYKCLSIFRQCWFERAETYLAIAVLFYVQMRTWYELVIVFLMQFTCTIYYCRKQVTNTMLNRYTYTVWGPFVC